MKTAVHVAYYVFKMAEWHSGSFSEEFLLPKPQEHSSGVVRAFWRGKLAQLHAPFSTERKDAIVCNESCLSPSVRALLTRPLVAVSGQEGGRFINADLTLNWGEVKIHLAKGKRKQILRRVWCVGGCHQSRTIRVCATTIHKH